MSSLFYVKRHPRSQRVFNDIAQVQIVKSNGAGIELGEENDLNTEDLLPYSY